MALVEQGQLAEARSLLRALGGGVEEAEDLPMVEDEAAAAEEEEMMDDIEEEDGGFVSEIMMCLDTEKVKGLRTEFSRRIDGLELPEFCHVMKSCLLRQPRTEDGGEEAHGGVGGDGGDSSKLRSMSDARLVAHFCELFEQVDVNGNGSLDWDEFTSHIVEMVMATHDHKPDIIQNYTPGIVKEVSKRRTSYIKELYYFEANDAIVAPGAGRGRANFRGSSLGRFPLVSADVSTSEIISRSRLEASMFFFPGGRARAERPR